jgi:hypothetical protein
MVGAPYCLRDGIAWGLATPRRSRVVLSAGLIFWIVLMVLGVWGYGKRGRGQSGDENPRLARRGFR